MKRFSVAVLLGLGGLISGGCESPEKVAEPSVKTAELLKQADLLDGQADHVIGKCYICGLGMDGTVEHTATYNGYTAHLCSQACQQHFQADPEKVVMTTDIPAVKAK